MSIAFFTPLARIAIAGAFAVSAVSASAAINVDFDAVTQNAAVDEFYNGGTDSAAASGPNLGVSFQSGDWNVITGFGQTSQPNFAYSGSGLGTVNVAAGFGNSFGFTYGAFTNTVLSVYSGLNGSGTLLASTVLGANDPNAFDPFTLTFAGTARSVAITGGAAQFGFDDLAFGNAGVPEPGVWMTLILGFGAIGGAMRRRRVGTTVSFA